MRQVPCATLKDSQGLDVTTDNPEIIRSINHFINQLLCYGNEPQLIITVADGNPDSIFVNIIAGYLTLLRENVDPSVDYATKAKKYLNNARKNIARATKREKAYLEVAETTLRNEGSACPGSTDSVVKLLENIVEEWPNDMLALKLTHMNYFNLGDSLGMLRSARKASKDKSHPFHHYYLGMLAFAEVECGNAEDAERLGVEATRLACEQRDPWAHHAVAHCMEVSGRLDEGIRWMEGHSHLWEQCGSFMYTHNWWHTGLYYIDREASDVVLKLYDEKIWGRSKEAAQDQLGAAALLWRMNLRGVPLADRWEDIADYMQPHIKEHIQPFIDLHYIYALAAAGREERVQEMLDSLQTTSCFARKQKEVTLPLANAFVAHARGNYEEAFEHLDPIIGRAKEVGGSNAQLDMFEQTYIDSLLRCKQYEKAKPLLEARSQQRPRTPLVLRQLSQVYQRLGQQEAAQQASEKATRWSNYYANHSPHEINNFLSGTLTD